MLFQTCIILIAYYLLHANCVVYGDVILPTHNIFSTQLCRYNEIFSRYNEIFSRNNDIFSHNNEIFSR